MKPYSMDLRKRVMDAYDLGKGTQEQVAERFDINVQSLKNWLKLRRETGSIEPRPHAGGHEFLIQGEDERHLLQVVEDHPDATLEEYIELSGFDVSVTCMFDTLKRLNVTYKKISRIRGSLAR